MTTFLMTYRTFTTSDELFDYLVARYFLRPPADLTQQQMQQWMEKKQLIVQLRCANRLRA
jgi:son of sevenless-like protein